VVFIFLNSLSHSLARDLQPFWQRSVDVGNVTEFVMKGLSKDDYFFAVQAIDKDGNASAPSFPKAPPRPPR